MLGDSQAGFGDPVKALGYYAEAYRLGNVPSLKKLADLEYAMGMFDEAVEHYGALYLDSRYSDEVAPRLCLDACEKGRMAAAKEFYGKMDASAPENFGAIAEYHSYVGDLFSGMCALSSHPGVLFGDLSPELRREYCAYADSLVEDVPADGKLKELPSAETFPAKLVALRASAVTFLRGPEAGERYFRFVSSAVALSEDTGRQEEIDVTVIGALAPCHDLEAMGFAVFGEDAKEGREQSLVDLLAIDARLLAETYRECAIDPKRRTAYSSMLCRLSDFFVGYDPELSGFFREA